jgi:hypothetical protein
MVGPEVAEVACIQIKKPHQEVLVLHPKALVAGRLLELSMTERVVVEVRGRLDLEEIMEQQGQEQRAKVVMDCHQVLLESPRFAVEEVVVDGRARGEIRQMESEARVVVGKALSEVELLQARPQLLELQTQAVVVVVVMDFNQLRTIPVQLAAQESSSYVIR